MSNKTIFVQIGNSDDKLTQSDWAQFCIEVNDAIERTCTRVHGRWLSAGDSPWQNACWCVVPLDADHEQRLRDALAQAASAWQQDSIAWSEAATEFITPTAVANA